MKQDPNYIAAVEKAIAEKYGKETVQDFRDSWTEDKEKAYLEQVKYKKTNKSKKKNRDTVSRTCPVCKTYSFSIKDDLYMNRFQCCYECHVKYMPNPFYEKKWLSGWRPDILNKKD
jgi:hypothetical protein|tara:strand:+ start:1054 stop:1401 length:348 start_codon:yes stop_codon:yes gene_type:complete